MDRELSEPSAYLRPVGQAPKPKPVTIGKDLTRAEKLERARPKGSWDPPKLISFGEQLETCRRHKRETEDAGRRMMEGIRTVGGMVDRGQGDFWE